MEVRRVNKSYHTLGRVDRARYHAEYFQTLLRFLSKSLILTFKGWYREVAPPSGTSHDKCKEFYLRARYVIDQIR